MADKAQPDAGSIAVSGMISVAAALDGGVRDVTKLLADRELNHRRLGYLKSVAARSGCEVELAARDAVDELAGVKSGGVAALCGARSFAALDELELPEAAPFVVMLDGVEDPFSLGWAIRSVYAAGADAIVLRSREWGASEATILRASAGAFDLCAIAQVDSAQEAAGHFAQQGMAVAVTAKADGSQSIYEADLTGPLFMLIGGEKRGVQRSVLSAATLLLEIPYGRQFGASVGTASAAAIIAFEAMRQRGASR